MATKNFIALDVGTVRVGIAFAGNGLMIARPVRTIAYSEDDWSALDAVINELKPSELVIGLPRGLDGQETEQTMTVRRYAEQCQQRYAIPVNLQDEALTSVRAKEILAQTTRKQDIDKKEVDAVAASLILSDYLEEHKQ